MAGTLAAGPLTRPVRFAIASRADEAGIRHLLRENPMRGAIDVTFEREPDYFHGEGLAESEDRTLVAYEDDQLVCLGRCTRRECWVNGSVHAVGYLGELRLDHAARRRFTIVRGGYQFFREQQKDGLHFTSIATDNARARRLLESGVRGLPTYEFLGELTTLLIAVSRQARLSKLHIAPATARDLPTLVRILNDHGKRHQLAPVWTESRLQSLARHGLPLQQLYLARADGEAVACGALWDQRGFRQVVVQGYAGGLRLARPWLNAIGGWFGQPKLPVPGRALAQAFLSPLGFAEGAEACLGEFVAALLPQARALGLEWITLALPSGDARLAALRRMFFTRHWPSRLYCVRWPGQPTLPFAPPEARFLPDVALL